MKMDFVNEKILPAVGRFQSNKYMKAITAAFMQTMPALMAGALFSLIVSFPAGQGYKDFLNRIGLAAILNAGVDATTNCIALYLAASIGYAFAAAFGKDPIAMTIISLLSFIMVTPFNTTVLDSAKNSILVNGVIPINWLGAQGIFTALIVGVSSSVLYNFIINKNWKIKMPESVPQSVSRPFEAVIPAIIIGTIFLLIRGLFSLTSYGNIHQFIYSILQIPLTNLGNSLAAFIVALLVIHILWLFGIHGTLVVLSVALPFWIGPAMENQAAVAAGLPAPHMLTMTYLFCVMQWLGGPGCLIGLTPMMALTAKSQRYKTLGRIAVVPTLFNVIEPTVFGFPLVLNPIMAVPFIGAPLIIFLLGYFAMKIGLIGIPSIALPTSVFTMPFIPGGFLVGAGFGFGIFLIIGAVISTIIYLPFFRIADNLALKEEVSGAQAT